MKELKRSPSTRIKHKGKTYSYFGGTNYLGLHHHFRFKKRMLKGVLKYGVHFGASRKSNVGLNIYNKSEKMLAELCGAKMSVTVSSGYLAGQLIASIFESKKYKCYYAPLTHPALEGKKFKKYPDTKSLKEALVLNLEKKPKKTPVIFLDTIDFAGLNYPNYEWLSELPLDGCIVVADDSHGIGITENRGGSYAILKALNPKELIVCASLGKGFGIGAGVILGSKKRIESIKKLAFFNGASPASPGQLYTFTKSQEIYDKQYKKLQRNIKYFTKKVKNLATLTNHPGHPAFEFENESLHNALKENEIIVTEFRYPTDSDPLISRIVLNARHSKDDIDKLVAVVNDFL